MEMTGKYGLDGNTFDFHGKLGLDAKLSHTMTGWKSILLKPVDPFFRENGANRSADQDNGHQVRAALWP